MRQLKQDDIIIAFMGPTGAGKSRFIDLLSNEEGKRSGHSLRSATTEIQATRVRHPTTGTDNLVLVDTPGFDDTFKSDLEIILMISGWLEKTYKRGIKLRGLVYLHDITNSRMTRGVNKNLRIFRELCGDSAASRVVLVSTKWQAVDDMEIAQRREKELLEEYWLPFIKAGSHVERMAQSTRAEAWRIVEALIQGAGDGTITLAHERAVALESERHQKEVASERDFFNSLLPRTKISGSPPATRKLSENDIIIAFMGPTGAGKSTFIGLLANDEGQRSAYTLKPGNAQIQTTRVKHPNTGIDNIVLVDTPGFGDTLRSDFEVLAMISDWLAKTYKNGIKISGLVYVIDITDARMTGTAYMNLRTFASICGDAAMSRIVVVSTKWNDIKHDARMKIAEGRESELIEEFLKPFIQEGARVKRLNRVGDGHDGERAWGIVKDLVQTHQGRTGLLLQEELVDLNRELNETGAWKTLSARLQKSLVRSKDTLILLFIRHKASDSKTRKKLRKRYMKDRSSEEVLPKLTSQSTAVTRRTL